jgi:hypothetical protein
VRVKAIGDRVALAVVDAELVVGNRYGVTCIFDDRSDAASAAGATVRDGLGAVCAASQVRVIAIGGVAADRDRYADRRWPPRCRRGGGGFRRRRPKFLAALAGAAERPSPESSGT